MRCPTLENEKLEFFKLDQIDRKVLFWLMDNVHIKNVKGWMEFIAIEYKEKGISIDPMRLYNEVRQQEF